MRQADEVGAHRSVRGKAVVRIQRWIDGPPAVEAPDAVGTPSAHEGVEHGVHPSSNPLAASDGKFVGITELQHLWYVEGGQTPLATRIIGILQAREASQPDVVGAGQRSVVHGLGEGISGQELEAMREALLRADLQSAIKRVGDGRLVASESAELRVAAY